jgi:hypothetical protein
MGCQDKNFFLDGEKRRFPEVPAIVPFIVDFCLSSRHKNVWQFNPSTQYGQPRPIPAPVSDKAAKGFTVTPTPFFTPNTHVIQLPAILGVLVILGFYFLLL